jgi:multiple sugar transport system substrate-binding protein
MSLTKNQIIVFGFILFIILIFVLIFAGVLPGLKNGNSSKKLVANLNFWVIGDLPGDYEGILTAFGAQYPKVKVDIRNFKDVKEYETALLEGLATNTGPDIFMIHRSWFLKHANKVQPLSAAKFPLINFRQLFPQIVENDFAAGSYIYGMPLSIDTLALIYNRDLLDQAAVVAPPATWEDFKTIIPRIVTFDEEGKIKRAGAAIGGAKNIEAAADILNLLMIQNGAKLVSDNHRSATFNSSEGLQALNFYTGFAESGSPVYTWNESLPQDVELFSRGEAAMIFNYAASLPVIRARNAFLNFAVAPIPQSKIAPTALTLPDYWAYTVSRASRYPDLAWDFIIKMTTDETVAEDYLQRTKKPPALKSLINKYLNDLELGVFARQALIARSWFVPDKNAVREVFVNMIEAVLQKRLSPRDALQTAQDQITQLLSRF